MKKSIIQSIDEDDYAELLTHISPIQIPLVMDKQTPDQHCESIVPTKGQYQEPNINTVQQFIALLQSDSDMVKFEAASSLYDALNIDNARTSKLYHDISYSVLIILFLTPPCFNFVT